MTLFQTSRYLVNHSSRLRVSLLDSHILFLLLVRYSGRGLHFDEKQVELVGRQELKKGATAGGFIRAFKSEQLCKDNAMLQWSWLSERNNPHGTPVCDETCNRQNIARRSSCDTRLHKWIHLQIS